MNLNEKIFSLYENILSKKTLILEQSKFVQSVPTIPGIDEMVWNKAPYGYDRGNLQMGVKWPGHNTHIHFGFTTPDTAIAIIKKTLELGLRAAENPYSDDVQPVHTGDSFHYEKFDGKYDGKILGKGLDVSGDREKMIQLFNWVVTDIGGGQPIPLVTPDDGTSTTSPLDYLENLANDAKENAANIALGAGGLAALGGVLNAGKNLLSKNNNSTNSTTTSTNSDNSGLSRKFVYGGKKESPFFAEEIANNSKKVVQEIFVTVGSVENQYPNLIFSRRTKADKLNKTLLDDIQKATEISNTKVTIDFAKKGHGKYAASGYVSRHYEGFAVDIDWIYFEGKKYLVSPSNQNIVAKFTSALSSMGYHKNSEFYKKNNGEKVRYPKAYLTFGANDHDNHVHVSNLTDAPSDVDPNIVTPSETQTSSPLDYLENMSDESKQTLAKVGIGVAGASALYGLNKSGSNQNIQGNSEETKGLARKFVFGGKKESPFFSEGLNEQTITGNFGRDFVAYGNGIKIPKNSNSKIYSAVDGQISKGRGCTNSIHIYFDNNSHYLRYCNLKTPPTSGQIVTGGNLGEPKDDVIVYLYDRNNNPKNLSYYKSQNLRRTPQQTGGKTPVLSNTKFKSKPPIIQKQISKKSSVISKGISKDPSLIGKTITKLRTKQAQTENYYSEKIEEQINKIKKLL
jgi:hypothetical protein